jgi:sugar lactone lactonase YvrE
MDNTLYVLTAGGGCSRGLPDSPSGIMQVQPDGSWSVIADFSAYLSTHDDELPKDDDWEPDGSLWNMVVAEGDFYVVDTNHGELYKATPDGTITRLTTITEQFGQINPTALAYRDGYFYLSNLHGFPITQGASILLKVSLNGDFEVIAEGLTGVLSLAFDAQGELYALETSTTDNALPQPGAGRVVRVRSGEPLQTVVSGLTFPTAMTFGPDGKLYIAHNAYWNEAGLGEIIRIDMEPE